MLFRSFLGCQTTETQTNIETKIFQSNTETQTFSGFDEGLQSCETPRRLRSARRRDRDIGAKARSRSTRCFTRSRSMVCAFAIDALRHRNRREGKIAIGSVLRAILANDLGDRSFGRSRRAQLSLWRDRSFGRSLYFRG